MNRVQVNLTRYLWLSPLGATFKRVERIPSPDGQEVEVIVYKATYTGKVAQHTLFGTIIVDERAFHSSTYLSRVITHELAHKRQWYGYLAYPLAITFGLAALFMLFGTFIMLLLSLFLNPKLAVQALYFLLLTIPVIIIPCGYSWFIEYKAEAETFKKLGIETVVAIDSELPPQGKAPVLWCIVNRMTHPPPKLTEKIYRHFNRLN